MDIERINENTVKFYISYLDIEERGFDREEIWYNRERSEELFWEMMDEIHHEEEFVPEGPLWIQVQAMEKGLEVLVTKAQLSKDGQRFELPIPEDKLKDFPINEQIEEFLDEHFQTRPLQDNDDDLLEFMVSFKDFEDIISLSKRNGLDNLKTKLFSYNNKYYLYVEFTDELFEEEDIDNILSILLEYGEESTYTVHRLEEYGNTVMERNVFATINEYFK
ncbi:adaptor protein MecA [Bacillus sp. FJAT-49736]|uniref:adaptor protein MecA n=1 Tax=Bacillus sp. FJAT-49736 TaxID=2833582 RepID=UPI001BC947A3|nr:adaptor protein MecA [Bacillus sp. FJAT-49736]MBS4172050.1 adaptor protein MecA [Bacillus sp. FJAT-49736]